MNKIKWGKCQIKNKEKNIQYTYINFLLQKLLNKYQYKTRFWILKSPKKPAVHIYTHTHTYAHPHKKEEKYSWKRIYISATHKTHELRLLNNF